MLKFLIDECLSPKPAQLARDRGFHESFHVSWLGKAGWKDWELRNLILGGDWTFVTTNEVFRLAPIRIIFEGRNDGGTEQDRDFSGAGSAGRI